MWQHGGKYNKSRSVLVLLLEEILHLLISIDNEYTSQVVQEFFHPHYHLNHIRYPDRFDPPWLQTKATSDPWQSSSSPQQRGVSMSYKKIGYKVMNTNPIHFFETGSGIKYTAYSTFFFQHPYWLCQLSFSSNSKFPHSLAFNHRDLHAFVVNFLDPHLTSQGCEMLQLMEMSILQYMETGFSLDGCQKCRCFIFFLENQLLSVTSK